MKAFLISNGISFLLGGCAVALVIRRHPAAAIAWLNKVKAQLDARRAKAVKS